MKSIKKRSGEDNMVVLLMGILITGLIYFYRTGISGNDFWWHVKVGEWISNNNAVPKGIDVFSWFAKQNGIRWIPQEWLSEVIFFKIHNIFSNTGIFVLSLFLALSMTMLIVIRNKKAIKTNVLLSILYLLPIIFLFPLFFYGRPQMIGFFLLFTSLLCLYRFKENEKSKSIYFIPFLSILWTNIHGGSSALLYILCFIFLFSGVLKFSFGKLKGEKLSKRQICIYLVVGLLSILAVMINPNGYKNLIYPFTNIGDSFMQSFIIEWKSPDAKQIYQTITFFMPLLFVGISMVVTEKKIKMVDFLIFLFFAYLSFRSVRFSILFYIASTFFVFDYLMPRKIKPMKTKLDLIMFYMIAAMFIGINIYSISTLIENSQDGKLISMTLDHKIIELVKKESPKRIFNDYNFGGMLIYNDIATFVDEREDLFAKYNLKDAVSLLMLSQADNQKKTEIFNPEKIIEKYNFDGFLIQPNRPLVVYLRSKPDKYKILMKNDSAIYFKVISKETESSQN
jgi:hypothetical protein